MQAVILAGGFGTRLRGVVGDVPKPMAPLNGRPFLCWLLEYMAEQGITEAALCLHHLPAAITDYFGDSYAGITLHYHIEQHPLGTGGAIRAGLKTLAPTQPIFVLNGDSLVRLNYRRMMHHHVQHARLLTLGAYHVADCSRYSRLTPEYNRIVRYERLGDAHPALASVGLYVMSPPIFDGHDLPEIFSFEQDFLVPNVPTLTPAYYDAIDYFIDIGVPDDYARAAKEVPELIE